VRERERKTERERKRERERERERERGKDRGTGWKGALVSEEKIRLRDIRQKLDLIRFDCIG
jgi:hypothetical protein